MMVIPILALVVASSMAGGGVDTVLITVDRYIREGLTAVVIFLRSLF
jgi:hypothetical protein